MRAYTKQQSPQVSTDIYVRLLQILNEDRLFLKPDVSAITMAERLGCAQRHISAALHVNTGNNFSHLLNTLRVREACRRLRSHRYSKKSIEEIGFACGYKSRQAFYVAFMRHVGMTPAEWRDSKAPLPQQDLA